MTAYQVQNPFFNVTDANGAAVTGGRVYIGVAGADPEVYPQSVYWDAAQTLAASQPLAIKGGYIVNGTAPAALYTGTSYSIRAYDSLGVQIYYNSTVAPVATTDALSSITTSITALQKQIGSEIGVVTYGASSSLTVSQVGYLIKLTGTGFVLALPAAATLTAGNSFKLVNEGSGTWTLTAATGSFVGANLSGSITSLNLVTGTSLNVTFDGTNWVVDGWANGGNLLGALSITTSGTLPVTSIGYAIELGGSTGTLTLPAAASLSKGNFVKVASIASGIWTIAAPTGGFVGGGVAGVPSSISLPVNGTINLTFDGTNWIVDALTTASFGGTYSAPTRTLGSTYTNSGTTNRFVFAVLNGSPAVGSTTFTPVVGGVTLPYLSVYFNSGTYNVSVVFIVPPTLSYSITAGGNNPGGAYVVNWVEL